MTEIEKQIFMAMRNGDHISLEIYDDILYTGTIRCMNQSDFIIEIDPIKRQVPMGEEFIEYDSVTDIRIL